MISLQHKFDAFGTASGLHMLHCATAGNFSCMICWKFLYNSIMSYYVYIYVYVCIYIYIYILYRAEKRWFPNRLGVAFDLSLELNCKQWVWHPLVCLSLNNGTMESPVISVLRVQCQRIKGELHQTTVDSNENSLSKQFKFLGRWSTEVYHSNLLGGFSSLSGARWNPRGAVGVVSNSLW